MIFGHVLRAASPPVVTVIGLAFGNVMTGTVLVENIFSWPGIGQYSFRSATTLDLPVIVGVMLFVALVYILANMAVDVLYGVIDPRSGWYEHRRVVPGVCGSGAACRRRGSSR